MHLFILIYHVTNYILPFASLALIRFLHAIITPAPLFAKFKAAALPIPEIVQFYTMIVQVRLS